MTELPLSVAAPADLIDAAKVLDTFFIPTRYPDSHPEGPPFVHYGRYQGEEAIRHAHAVLGFVCAHLADY